MVNIFPQPRRLFRKWTGNGIDMYIDVSYLFSYVFFLCFVDLWINFPTFFWSFSAWPSNLLGPGYSCWSYAGCRVRGSLVVQNLRLVSLLGGWDPRTCTLGNFPRDPQWWDPLPISFPYHSHTSRDSYGSGMGVVWEWGSHYWGSLEFPLTLPETHIFAPKNAGETKFGISKIPQGPEDL